MLRLHQYAESDLFRLSALEVQKLAYFMQEAGEALYLRYVKAKYGPYADNLNLNQVLIRVTPPPGWIRGFLLLVVRPRREGPVRP